MKQENKYPLDNPAKSSPRDRKKSPERILKEKQEKKARKSKIFGWIVTILQGILTAGVLGLLFTIDLLPFKYAGILFVILILAFVFTWKTQGHKGIHVIGKIFGLLMIPVLAIAVYGLIVVNATFSAIAVEEEGVGQIITESVFSIHINDGGEEKIWMVNKDTYQILEITTPDKYYIMIPDVSEGKKDTLENAKKYGEDAVKSALGTLYETTIPYHVNIDIEKIKSSVNQKYLSMMVRPQILIDIVDGNLETNLSKGHIRQLIKMYLNEDVTWELYPVSATGIGTRQKTYTNPGEETLVMEPDKESIAYIIELMNRVEDSEKLNVADLKAN